MLERQSRGRLELLKRWGLWGHAHTNEELVAAARAEIAALKGGT